MKFSVENVLLMNFQYGVIDVRIYEALLVNN